MQAVNTTIRNNRFQGYRDKAYQMSYGSGTIEGNTFIDSAQPIRGPVRRTRWARTFVIRVNVMRTTSDREACTGITVDGTYHLVFEGNTIECYRGLRLSGGTQAIVRDNVIDGNPRQGVLIGGSASCRSRATPSPTTACRPAASRRAASWSGRTGRPISAAVR